MPKILNFIKANFGYILLNIFMAGFTTLILFTEFSAYGIIALVCGVCLCWIAVPLTIEAYRAVCENDEYKGVNYSVLGGFIGGFVAVHTKNKEYAKKKTINNIFIIWLYIAFVYPIMVGILFLIGFFSLL